MSTTDNNEKMHNSGTSYKYPIFDGEDTTKFKGWWEVVFATLQIEDLEEYVTEDYKDKDMHTEESTTPQDPDNEDQAAK